MNRPDPRRIIRNERGEFDGYESTEASSATTDAAFEGAAAEFDGSDQRNPSEVHATNAAAYHWGAGADVEEITLGVYAITPHDTTQPGGYVAVLGAANISDDNAQLAAQHGLVGRYVDYQSGVETDGTPATATVWLDDPELDDPAWEADMRARSPRVSDYQAIVGSDLDHGWRAVALACPDAHDEISARADMYGVETDPARYTTAGMLADMERWGYNDYARQYRTLNNIAPPTPADRCDLAAQRVNAAATHAVDDDRRAMDAGRAEALTFAADMLRNGSVAGEDPWWDAARKEQMLAQTAQTRAASAAAIGRRAGWIHAIEATRDGHPVSPAEIATRTAPQPAT